MITALISSISKFYQPTFLTALVNIDSKEGFNVLIWTTIAMLFFDIVVGLYVVRKNYFGKNTIYIVLVAVVPIYFIGVMGVLLSLWGAAIIFSLGAVILGWFYYFLISKKVAENSYPKIRQNILKKIEENKTKGFTNKSMQEYNMLPNNKTLLGYGFTEEELKDFGLTS
jgi:O-antigen/teichoic acid export membrane protein